MNTTMFEVYTFYLVWKDIYHSNLSYNEPWNVGSELQFSSQMKAPQYLNMLTSSISEYILVCLPVVNLGLPRIIEGWLHAYKKEIPKVEIYVGLVTDEERIDVECQ